MLQRLGVPSALLSALQVLGEAHRLAADVFLKLGGLWSQEAERRADSGFA